MINPRTAEEDAKWLVANANGILAELSWPDIDSWHLTKRLRKSFSPVETHLLIELLELRHRAKTKYSSANRMYFHRRGWEQATDEIIADYKATRFTSPANGIVDLCCGIGGDAIGLVKRHGSITIIDRDPATVTFAGANAELHTNQDVIQVVNDLRNVPLGNFTQWHIDPDRRPNEQRRSNPKLCEPPIEDFLKLPGLSKSGAIKLSPAADVSWLLSKGAELEWIGHKRECQQQVAWLGELARHPGCITATLLDGAGVASSIVQEAGQRSDHLDVAHGPPKYIYEPQPPVLAAGLDTTLAHQEGLKRLSTNVAYYASDELIETPLLTGFKLIDDIAFREKSLTRRLDELDATVGEVKKRGVSIEPGELLKTLRRANASSSVVLIVYSRSSGIRVAITQRSEVADP